MGNDTYHGVGFKSPRDPREIASLREEIGAVGLDVC